MNSFFTAAWEPQLRSVLRIAVGLLFSFHGWQKWFAAFGGFGGKAVPLDSMLGAAGPIETIGGALILLGLFTRPTAFILSGQMAVAYFMAHSPRGANPLLNQGELAVLYSFLFLWFSAAGPGNWSVDAILGKPNSAVRN
jgi:putative oxidoreductase